MHFVSKTTNLLCLLLMIAVACLICVKAPYWFPVNTGDTLNDIQRQAILHNKADWGYWGTNPEVFTEWDSHSNRLIPIYTFGIDLDQYQNENSIYRDLDRINQLYGRQTHATVHAAADYIDQTDIYRLQQDAVEQGKKYIFLVVFDGMDWQTTRAAAIYRSQQVNYSEGRGNGLAFQDYDKTTTDFGFHACSPFNDSTTFDIDAQIVTGRNERLYGGYNPLVGGFHPWDKPASYPYLIGKDLANPHAYTDSAASATSMTCGIKTYNGAINVDPDGQHVTPIARELQAKGFLVGAVTSVPFSHATPACTYGNNVERGDYQDISRDLLGISSIANRQPLSGMDVLIGCGWGVEPETKEDFETVKEEQGINFVVGNKYLAEEDLAKINYTNGGRYEVAIRTTGVSGKQALDSATNACLEKGLRLFGMFGTKEAHLPYATANGDFVPTAGRTEHEVYTKGDLFENPTLADMTESALKVLEKNEAGFWLLVEAGDVDWANHQNSIDNSIGAVFSGEAAFNKITEWIERNDCWDESAVIVTADHGHLFVMERPEALIPE